MVLPSYLSTYFLAHPLHLYLTFSRLWPSLDITSFYCLVVKATQVSHVDTQFYTDRFKAFTCPNDFIRTNKRFHVLCLFSTVLAANRHGAFGCAPNCNCCIILEKGDLFWSTTSGAEVVAFRVAARPFRSLLSEGGVARPFLQGTSSITPLRLLPAVEEAALRAVSRPRSLVRDVCLRRAPLVSLLPPVGSSASVTKTKLLRDREARWRCRNLAHLTVLMPRSKKLRRCAIWRRTNVIARSVP